MSIDVELLKIAESMQALEGRFVDSRSLGLHLSAEDEAEFKSLAVEAKSMLDSELGHLNNFSSNLFHAINSGSGGFLGGPSLASVKSARAIVEGGDMGYTPLPLGSRITTTQAGVDIGS